MAEPEQVRPSAFWSVNPLRHAPRLIVPAEAFEDIGKPGATALFAVGAAGMAVFVTPMGVIPAMFMPLVFVFISSMRITMFVAARVLTRRFRGGGDMLTR